MKYINFVLFIPRLSTTFFAFAFSPFPLTAFKFWQYLSFSPFSNFEGLTYVL